MKTTEKLDNFPPILVRLLARQRHSRPLTEEEISKVSGLPLYLVDTYSWRCDWDSITTVHAMRFLAGCGMDIDDAQAWRRVLDYLSKKPTFRYLRTSKRWKQLFQPMLKAYRQSFGTHIPVGKCQQITALLTRLSWIP